MKRTRQDKQVDLAIEREYYKQAVGRQINIMNIPKLFRAVAAMLEENWSMEEAMKKAIRLFCEPEVNAQ